MMKPTQLLTSIALLTLTSAIYAETPLKKNPCPAVAFIKSTTFSKVYPPYEDVPNYWGFLSDNFTYHKATWNIQFSLNLADAHTDAEALQQGQAYFNTTLQFFDTPQYSDMGNTVACMYAFDDNGVVFATTPPQERAWKHLLKAS